MRPPDVAESQWDCTLELRATPDLTEPRFALRIGLRFVRSLGKDVGLRLVAAREDRVFDGLDDLVRGASCRWPPWTPWPRPAP